ncbi:hypothetical protein ABZ897_41530 [Nonomuraea sp. NPDC046802]|uniref:hypothetical protein n=1 Tax=Nonomuraea sp. NPDC046802 TaxID=3154919 RepID=UPI0033E152AA
MSTAADSRSAPLKELRALACAGGPATTGELAELLAQHGRIDDLRALAARP